MEIELMERVLAIITLALGGALIVYLYDAYKIVKQKSLLILMYGLFVLIIGIVLPDITPLFTADEFWIFWSALFSRLLVIIGICAMIFSIVRG
ncbi:DNA integrity scanning protein DisA with diadenylate cyclase activity [Methanomicrobium sp. W14]|uniref:hypothetical protein n=1 Tax=Methanomicrobium sp. W14 TaxID=2817839 RepID=UPI001AE6F1F4|nr:hypothetical protein [Methanomicrobium sp. W14]MBP2132230.1 DNA integrity scanning protein DisA with diadenylate cyclase activity [Methanomicrobium sp. W14]